MFSSFLALSVLFFLSHAEYFLDFFQSLLLSPMRLVSYQTIIVETNINEFASICKGFYILRPFM